MPAHAAQYRQGRGVSILEALVALLVLAIGVLGALRLNLATQVAADDATRRTQALRLAQRDLDAARTFVAGMGQPAPAGQPSFDRVAAAGPQAVTGVTGASGFTLERRVATAADGRLKALATKVSWVDRGGVTRALALNTWVGGTDPTLGAVLMAGPARGGPFAPRQRAMAVPPAAHPLGPGRSVFKPQEAGTVAWVFDHASGLVVSRCQVPAGVPTPRLGAADLHDCEATQGLALAGYIGFGGAAAQPLALVIVAAPGKSAPRHECADDSSAAAAAGRRHVAYHCAVFASGQPPRWSGRLEIVPRGWTIGPAPATDHRVCRHGTAAAGNDTDSSLTPPYYVDVDRPLLQQNFLVVPTAQPCPAGGAGEPTTQGHQP